MLTILAFVVGAIWGTFVAVKRGGNRLDILQYGAVYGIILALIVIVGYMIAVRANLI